MIDEHDRIVVCDVREQVQRKLKGSVADHDIEGMDHYWTMGHLWKGTRHSGEVFICFRMD